MDLEKISQGGTSLLRAQQQLSFLDTIKTNAFESIRLLADKEL